MELVFKVYGSFEEAERDNKDQYRAMTPEQRLDILAELMRMAYGNPSRLERVHRFVERPRR
ncbi:MAG: hypothetical protein WD716_07910 [Fimbriimonadaceae bacterium]